MAGSTGWGIFISKVNMICSTILDSCELGEGTLSNVQLITLNFGQVGVGLSIHSDYLIYDKGPLATYTALHLPISLSLPPSYPPHLIISSDGYYHILHF